MTKIYLGVLDGGLNKDFKKMMEKQGFSVTTCSFVENKFSSENDINLRLNKTSWLNAAFRVLNNFINSLNYQIYHFRYGQSLLPWNMDLPILKILGKKIIMIFDGADIRQIRKLPLGNYLKENIKSSILKDLRRSWRHHWVSIWTDKLVVATPDLLDFAPSAQYIPNLCPNFIVKPKNKSNKNITILHAPSNRKIKGTNYIIAAIKKMQKEGHGVKLLLLENVNHKNLSSYYNRSDIVIDQLLIGAYGLVSIEGMLSSKPVVCYIRKDLKSKYPKDLPIISANPDNIYEVLVNLIKRKKEFTKIGSNGQKFVEKYLREDILGKKWAKIYRAL